MRSKKAITGNSEAGRVLWEDREVTWLMKQSQVWKKRSVGTDQKLGGAVEELAEPLFANRRGHR